MYMPLPGTNHCVWPAPNFFWRKPLGMTFIAREQLSALKKQVNQKIKVYRQEKAKYTYLMMLAAPTFIIPAAYYCIAGGIMKNLPINKRHRCNTLIKIINAIEYLSKTKEWEETRWYIQSKFKKLFNHFSTQLSDEILGVKSFDKDYILTSTIV